MNIAHFAYAGIGGHSDSIPTLCAALAARGHTVRLHLLEPAHVASIPGVELQVHPRTGLFKSLGESRSLKEASIQEARAGAEILHAHSLWTSASIYPMQMARGTRARSMLSPRGTLAPWALNHKKWRKRAFWHFAQKNAIAAADCLHATSERELEDIRALGFTNPVAIIPNSVAIPALSAEAKSGALRRLLFLGRVHPVKALDLLLRSWQIVSPSHSDWELVVAGEDDGGYLDKMKAFAGQLRLERVSFPGRVESAARDALYQSADLFVLPSHTENFGIAAAEALANGVPAVISKNAPWKDIEREGCGWWTETRPDILAACIERAMALPAAQLSEMGRRGRDWMARDFGSERIAGMMEQTYTWLAGGKDSSARPAWIQ